jgi:acetolactate synthase-1/2/3 large subunit
MSEKTMRVSDVIADYIYKLGVDSVFTVTGGGAMFLNDAIAVHPDLNVVCNHHEQACAMAAVGYAKLRNSYSCAVVTTGCGSTNAITGLLDAWQDNVPCVFVSGQVKRKETSHNSTVPLRQFGVQEADIIPIVKPLTKYAVMLNDPEDVLYELE